MSFSNRTVARANGFTLIEVMIVVAVIGILIAVAFPSYKSYLRRSNRAEAQSFMMAVASKEEIYFQNARVYKAVAGNGDYLADLNLSVPEKVSQNYAVVVTLPTTSPPTFTITATASGDQANDKDSSGGNATLVLNSDGSRSWGLTTHW